MSGSNSGLAGKVAIVTGAGQGGGYGAAIALAREGAAVVLVGRTRSKLEKVSAEIAAIGGKSLVYPADVSSREQIEATVAATVAEYGRVDVLVCAAQSPDMRSAALIDVTDEEVDDLWRSGAVATLAFMRAVHPHMAKAGGGSIINFGSGCIENPAKYGVYAGVKAAIQAISRAAAIEWASDKIRVNTVLPMVASPSADLDFAQHEGRADAVAKAIPLGRMGDPERDIGRPVVFLAGEDGRFLTGSTLPLDGGLCYIR